MAGRVATVGRGREEDGRRGDGARGRERRGVSWRRPLSDMRGLLPSASFYAPGGRSPGPTLAGSNYHGPLAPAEGRLGVKLTPPLPPQPSPTPHPPTTPYRASHICTRLISAHQGLVFARVFQAFSTDSPKMCHFFFLTSLKPPTFIFSRSGTTGSLGYEDVKYEREVFCVEKKKNHKK